MEYLTRSKAALRLSVNTFFDKSQAAGRKVYIWTFTLREVLSVPAAFAAWRKLAKALWLYGIHPETKEQTIVGIRVAELHPGGHGVHFHVLLNRRIPIRAVRARAEKFGFFWTDVRQAHNLGDSLGRYLCKYLSKSDRAPCMAGRRLWQSFGEWGHTKCKDVEIRSEFVAAFHARRAMLKKAAAICALQGREYRMEGNLETMAHAQEHVTRVALGLAVPFMPALWFTPAEIEPPPMGYEDWIGQFSELESCIARAS